MGMGDMFGAAPQKSTPILEAVLSILREATGDARANICCSEGGAHYLMHPTDFFIQGGIHRHIDKAISDRIHETVCTMYERGE